MIEGSLCRESERAITAGSKYCQVWSNPRAKAHSQINYDTLALTAQQLHGAGHQVDTESLGDFSEWLFDVHGPRINSLSPKAYESADELHMMLTQPLAKYSISMLMCPSAGLLGASGTVGYRSTCVTERHLNNLYSYEYYHI